MPAVLRLVRIIATGTSLYAGITNGRVVPKVTYARWTPSYGTNVNPARIEINLVFTFPDLCGGFRHKHENLR